VIFTISGICHGIFPILIATTNTKNHLVKEKNTRLIPGI
jgi:hypothetical protein